MIVVTGGAGFIGSNLVKRLNDRGEHNIVVVDDLTDGGKFRNLVDCRIRDYWDKQTFIERVQANRDLDEPPSVVFHQGACTVTTEWDGRYMMQNNFEYSKTLLEYCLAREIRFIYASSAAVYGSGAVFREEPDCEAPLNPYGYSKLLFDQYVRQRSSTANCQVVGLRYFNAYGDREDHKGTMASMAYHFRRQLLDKGVLRLFEGSDGYAHGEQRRDFVYVFDIVSVNLWFLDNPDRSGIFNVGTGRSQSFNELAGAVIGCYGRGSIEYIPFPDKLRGHYQSFTEADITRLRGAGYEASFTDVGEGVADYVSRLDRQHAA